MKLINKLLFGILISAIISSCADDDYVTYNYILNDDVSLSTQAEVENFGLEGYELINGVLRISEDENNSDPITDLSALNTVENVLTLYVQKTSSLENLNGLTNLKFAENGGIIITENQALQSLDGLNNLTTIDNIVLIDNPNLSDISSLSNVNGEIERLYIGRNAMSNLLGLNNIVEVLNGLEIYENPTLQNLNGLTSISTVENLIITNNEELSDFCGLERLVSVGIINNYYGVSGNVYNPTKEQLLSGECN